jgi:uncharacterized oxidoreductase
MRLFKENTMKMSGNTILITGGGSGIGRALAEKFQGSGNTVIIAGRNADRLNAVTAANPGMVGMALDISDENSITSFAELLIADYPELNIVINNAGMMVAEKVTADPVDVGIADATVITNLLGPIRLSSALLPHLLKQPQATLMTVSSGLAFVPLAMTPAYSATKAAIHSWSVAMRHQLKNSAVRVVELAPPYVQTELMGEQQAVDPHAMPLAEFIDEVMAILANDPDIEEVIVERCKPLRYAAENGNFSEVMAGLNAAFA